MELVATQYITANRTIAELPNRKAYSNASRKLVVRTRSAHPWRFTQAVSGAAHRLDQARLVVLVIELAAQAADMGLDDRGVRVEMKLPDMLQQHRPRDDLPRVAHQIFEQAELARLELD